MSAPRPVSWMVYLLLGGVLLLWWLNTPPGLLGKADAVGYAVCHRIAARSFQIAGRPVSLCARCSGQYLGFLLGTVFQLLVGRRYGNWPARKVTVVLLALVGVYAVDGLNSFLHLLPAMERWYLYMPNNTLRLLTGTGTGIALSAGFLPAFHRTVWRRWDEKAVFSGWRPLALVLLLGLGLDALVLLENPLILYPLSLLSAASVLLILTMAYTMVWLTLTRRENCFERLGQMSLPLAAGFTLGLLQVAALDVVRYWLTGTWDGFHL
ncbi:MAG: DUF2085 domain-containing protein [Anaerolineae bacterium]|nr:MAG: DUF2085 domain-containing protein [Anaerolineae bacterium]